MFSSTPAQLSRGPPQTAHKEGHMEIVHCRHDNSAAENLSFSQWYTLVIRRFYRLKSTAARETFLHKHDSCHVAVDFDPIFVGTFWWWELTKTLLDIFSSISLKLLCTSMQLSSWSLDWHSSSCQHKQIVKHWFVHVTVVLMMIARLFCWCWWQNPLWDREGQMCHFLIPHSSANPWDCARGVWLTNVTWAQTSCMLLFSIRKWLTSLVSNCLDSCPPSYQISPIISR